MYVSQLVCYFWFLTFFHWGEIWLGFCFFFVCVSWIHLLLRSTWLLFTTLECFPVVCFSPRAEGLASRWKSHEMSTPSFRPTEEKWRKLPPGKSHDGVPEPSHIFRSIPPGSIWQRSFPPPLSFLPPPDFAAPKAVFGFSCMVTLNK